ncbi:histidine phosphatase family protein [Nocardioides aestuarii]|uniref:Histidine phosphatase family protein n=1 Tax=Nocardioides aestuarii TaxID=252231 RepID=A0ABW4TK76_9ACTN
MGQVLVVRHGQASFGADDYDVLSSHGEDQARRLGSSLAALSPDLVVHGSLKRQRDTARLMAAAAGWSAELTEDVRWNELDQFSQFSAIDQMPDESDAAAFQRWYETAMGRWSSGDHDDDYTESYAAFHDRSSAALDAAAAGGKVVAVSSGGPISALVTRLLDGGPATYARLLPTTVNTGVTRIVSGRRGLTLVSYNEHSHLSPEHVTYR